MAKQLCSNCGNAYWVNLYVDNEYACPKCGCVEKERLIGQLSGRTAIAEE